MPLSVRLRGKVWHARGTLRAGRQVVTVPEWSTGCHSRADAQAAADAEAARIIQAALEGDSGRARRLTLDDCLLAYLRRPGGVRPYDRDRVRDFAERIGHRPVADLAAAWQAWLGTRGASMAPATAARWRAILQAAVTAGCTAQGVPVPRVPVVRVKETERAAYLTVKQRDLLLASYSPNARPVALLLCFGGLRTQEALRLDWRHVRLDRGEAHVPGAQAKSGRGRTVPLHPRVLAVLAELHAAQGRPDIGAVFLSARGRPYADTRGRGGNPLAKAHATACQRAGITGFRVHDWRHHFASWMVMTGTDLYTLMRLGGWSTPRMVQRYASVTADHAAQAIRRLA